MFWGQELGNLYQYYSVTGNQLLMVREKQYAACLLIAHLGGNHFGSNIQFTFYTGSEPVAVLFGTGSKEDRLC